MPFIGILGCRGDNFNNNLQKWVTRGGFEKGWRNTDGPSRGLGG